jgi:hypothetical protein
MTQFRWTRRLREHLRDDHDPAQQSERLTGLRQAVEAMSSWQFNRNYEIADLPCFTGESLIFDGRAATVTTPGGYVFRAANGKLRLEAPDGASAWLRAGGIERCLTSHADPLPRAPRPDSTEYSVHRYNLIDGFSLDDGTRVLCYVRCGADGDELHQVDVEHGAQRLGVRMDISYGVWKSPRRSLRKRPGEWRTAAARGNQRAAARKAAARLDPRWLVERPGDVTWDVFVLAVRQLLEQPLAAALVRDAEWLEALVRAEAPADSGLPLTSEMPELDDIRSPYCGAVGASRLFDAEPVGRAAYDRLMEAVVATIEVFDGLGGLEDFLADAYIANQRLR